MYDKQQFSNFVVFRVFIDQMKEIAALAAGYILGSLCFSIIASVLIYGKDVRKKGSGNAGATNMARSYGAAAGLITLLGDALKCVTALWLGKHLCGNTGVLFGGIGCLLGHCYPVFFGFRGGKGVAVGAALLYMLSWKIGLISTVVFLATALLSKKVSVGSVSAAAAASISLLFVRLPAALSVLVVFLTVLVIFRHRENLQRLIKGEEPDFSFHKTHR